MKDVYNLLADAFLAYYREHPKCDYREIKTFVLEYDESLEAQEKERVALFEKKMTAITPNLIQALQTLGDNAVLTSLTAALAPLALHEQQGIAASLDKVFKGSVLEPVLNNMQSRKAAAGSK